MFVTQQQQHSNIEYSVDYSYEADPVYASDEAEERAMEQVMTFNTYFPARRQHGHPCHQQRQHHAMMPRPAAARAVHDAATAVAAAAAGAADADVLVSAASQAWTQAQHVASRLAAADAAETAELITELEATMERMAAAEAGAAAAAAPDAFDRRWDKFDRGLFLGSALWSELVADVIDPLRRYVSGLDDYEPLGDDSFNGSSSSNGEHGAYSDVNSVSAGEWEHEDPLLQQLGLLPADPAPLPADADGFSTSWERSEEFDIGQLLLPEDNAPNNLALFGVRTPAEVAAVAAAAAAAAAEGGAGLEDGGESGPWSGMLDWLSAAPYLSPFDNIDPQKAAAALLGGCTLMVFVAFLFSIVDMRNTVHTAAAAAAAAAGGCCSSHSSSGDRPLPAGVAPLRTRARRAYACSGAVAAAAAAMGSACAGARSCAGCVVPGAGADELCRPLLVDVQDDLEAAVLPAQHSVALAPALQKFYNPLHYQALPDHA